MDVRCAYSALNIALTYGPGFSFVIFINVLITLLRPDIADKENRVKRVSIKNLEDIYDFVVIGGGSAGTVLANRLTEDAKYSVLLLEAGGDEPLFGEVPSLISGLEDLDTYKWDFSAEPSSSYCRSWPNHRCTCPRAKMLGGCSAHNGMLYVRGNRRDYDNWRDLGNPGWGYDEILPYFKKSENMTIPDYRNSSYHGTDGYLTIERFRYGDHLEKYFLQAGREMGYDVVDTNGETQTGFMPTQANLRDGLRCSTAKAFLRSASKRKNLHVSTHSMVHKILIDEKTKTAYGVRFKRDGKIYDVHVRREVILSAGAIQSPQILMLSGIGPKHHLKELGIRVIHDSPGVGENFQDHPVTEGIYYTIVDENNPDTNVHKFITLSGVKEFLEDRSGPLYKFLLAGVLAFVNTKFVDPALDYPDMEYTLDLTGGTVRNVFFTGGKNRTYGLRPSVLRPKSRGYVKLRDDNPETHPIIVYNYFKHPQDLRVMIEGVKLTYNYSKTRTLQRLKARLDPLPADECAHFPFFSDEYLGCYARYYTNSAYHLCGTCKMGPANDTMAVVDPRLKVYGIRRLRVIDASIIPVIPSGNINAPTIMIAEKAADMIKEDHRKSENTCEQYL
ncbi:glucose dehydrogenase [FAD, quinone]-like isoform X3 [Athalia rosae]|uniref:glucose dehydrogenase [FAD, quinone]-like isoform X3 n=1 Tax=Athalia rosae TaxID=37344 RepID=UPI00203359F7|nr:glucose dehydrogenase [FAD, quinone]-like isoform X3 [Athalia rosae]